jgi:hypothetical protein
MRVRGFPGRTRASARSQETRRPIKKNAAAWVALLCLVTLTAVMIWGADAIRNDYVRYGAFFAYLAAIVVIARKSQKKRRA